MSLEVSIKKNLGSFQLNVEFSSNEGTLGILGASGSGKSMTLKCIAGIETPDTGKIVLNGRTLFDSERHINLKPQQRSVGCLFQNYALFPQMTVEKNVLCGLCRSDEKRSRRKELAQESIDKMQLTGLEKRYPAQLSGGQQQRVALARILVSQPELLLLDEPFSSLDEYLKLQLQTEMKEFLQSFGKTAILVSHSRDEVYRLCDNLAFVADGKLCGSGSVKTMFENPGSRQAAILTGCKNIAEARKIGDFAVEVPAWNMRFGTKEPVKDGLTAIGIRAHAFSADETQNAAKVLLTEEIEEPFELLRKFRYQNAPEGAAEIWWRLSKELAEEKFPDKIGVAPKNIMLLYDT